MKEAYGVERDYELAEKLGVEPGTVSGWKKRRSVPKDYIKMVREATGASIDGTITNAKGGGGSMPGDLLTQMFLQLRGQMDKFDMKLDNLIEECSSLKSEVELLKKVTGECPHKDGSTSSRSRKVS